MPAAVKSHGEIEAEVKALRAKRDAEQAKKEEERKGWYGLVYIDSNGYASIVGNDSQGIWLGRADEIIPYLKKRGIDGKNIDNVLIAVKEFRSEQENQSCHLARENDTISVSIPPEKPNRATFRKDPLFLSLLDGLIAKGYGLPTIQKELKAKGFDVPYRTLGRWIKKHRDMKGAPL